MIEETEYELLRALLTASQEPPEKTLKSLIIGIKKVIPSKTCSLWRINTSAKCTSLGERDNFRPLPEESPDDGDFVHPICGSLIGYIISELKESGKPYVDIPDVQDPELLKLHASKDKVIEYNLRRLISIPIPDYDKDIYEIESILNIYLSDKEFLFTNRHAEIIKEHFSLTISRLRLITREQLTSDIIRVYAEKGKDGLSSMLSPIIRTVLKKYINYEGCSVFMWDHDIHKFALSETTGIKNATSRAEVFYDFEDGITGQLAKENKSRIIHDFENVTNEFGKNPHVWQETTVHPPKSFMFIPISNPTRPGEIIGIIRFTNRLNKNANVVDNFSTEDIILVEHACKLFSLYMEYERSENYSVAFSRHMSHEMLAPASSIRASSDRLLDRWIKPRFRNSLDNNIDMTTKYLQDIFDQADLQVKLSHSIQFISNRSGFPKRRKYSVEYVNLKNIIWSSNKIIIPQARIEGLEFKNIDIYGDFPSLYVDKHAFEQVFYNLMSNSIKYRDESDIFSISIKGCKLDRYEIDKSKRQLGYKITVSDNGLGIDKGIREDIFRFGYRKVGVERTNVRGLGIGLYVVKTILDDFYCKIWVSNNRKPTTFSIFIPELLRRNDFLEKEDWNNEQRIN